MEFDANKPKDWLKLFVFYVVAGIGVATGIFSVATIFKHIW